MGRLLPVADVTGCQQTLAPIMLNTKRMRVPINGIPEKVTMDKSGPTAVGLTCLFEMNATQPVQTLAIPDDCTGAAFDCAGGRKNLGNSDCQIKKSMTLEAAFRWHTWPHAVEFPILKLVLATRLNYSADAAHELHRLGRIDENRSQLIRFVSMV